MPNLNHDCINLSYKCSYMETFASAYCFCNQYYLCNFYHATFYTTEIT